MSRKPAFTIIEIGVAMAIVVALIAIAVPRFITSLQRQEFLTEAQELLSCVQQAQTLSVTPAEGLFLSGPGGQAQRPKFMAADLQYDAATQTLTCRVLAFALPSDSSSLTAVLPAQSASVLQTEIVKTSSNMPTVPNQRIYFGSLERGVVVTRAITGQTVQQSTALGAGLEVLIALQNPQESTQTVTLSIPTTGNPIQLLSN